jgi:hypothetical protein
MLIPGVYSDGERTVRLEEVYQDKCYVLSEGRLILIQIEAFVEHFRRLYR